MRAPTSSGLRGHGRSVAGGLVAPKQRVTLPSGAPDPEIVAHSTQGSAGPPVDHVKDAQGRFA